MESFWDEVIEGIPEKAPPAWGRTEEGISHAPKRALHLSIEEQKLALRNALRYFPKSQHAELAPEFKAELDTYGRIYMYRYRPKHPIFARPFAEYRARSRQAAAIQLMIQNNLDPRVAQHPEELITYGGNGGVFQNWAQYRLTMQYLAEMTDEQTLVLYSGHPLGLFPSSVAAPRVVVTNGMMIPNASGPGSWERFHALGVTQYGQMTAGSFMYIGPQGIVHGTTLTVLNAARRLDKKAHHLQGKLFVSSGLGGMSGAQPKAAVIAGGVGLIAEINPEAAYKRLEQGWVDEVESDLDVAIDRACEARDAGRAHSIAYLGNVVDLWERLAKRGIKVDLGSDQTSLHNPWSGGYYPAGQSFDESNQEMADAPEVFKAHVQASLRRQVEAIGSCVANGMYFFDYGNAFLLEADRAGAPIKNSKAKGFEREFIYPSYVQDLMGPLCFDYGFGPFRWVCTSGSAEDLAKTDQIAAQILKGQLERAPEEIRLQITDNVRWIEEAESHGMVVGSQARILYADEEGRIEIARAFNAALKRGELQGPIVLGRDHHDVSGTDSPYRETSNIYDGSSFTADMAVQNFVGDAFRGATWVSLHNGGGVGWGEVMNGGFGLVLDGSEQADQRLEQMLFWDVNNGIARRAWARNREARFAISRAMDRESRLRVTLPEVASDTVIESLF